MFLKTCVQFDYRVSRASKFVESLVTEVGSGSIRGPGLANLEIERRKIIFGKGNADKLMDDLVLYFSRYNTEDRVSSLHVNGLQVKCLYVLNLLYSLQQIWAFG